MSSALRTPAFRRMWAAGLVSDAGDWLLFIAMPLVVFRITGSALGTSAAFLVELLPAVALAPLAARLVARFDRRRLMMILGLLQAATLLPLLLVHDRGQLPLAFAVIAVQAGLAAVFEPAKNTLLPDVVAADALVSANALGNLGQNIARLAGGPLGGALLLLGGLPLVVTIDVASYLAAAMLIAGVRAPTATHPASASSDSGASAIQGRDGGLLAALRRPSLRSTFAIVLVSSVSQGMFLVLFVLFVVQRLHGSDADVGLLRGIQAVGAILAALALGLIAKSLDARWMAVLSAAVFGVLSLATWNLPLLSGAMGWYVLLFAIVGAPGVTLMTGLLSTLQSETLPQERAGAFAAVGLLSAVGQGAGILLAGLAGSPSALLVLLEVQGLLYLLAAGIGAWAARRPPRSAAARAQASSSSR